MRISDWSSDVCSSELTPGRCLACVPAEHRCLLCRNLMGLFWHSGHRNIVLPAICIQGRAIPCAQLTDRNKCGEVRHHSHPCALIRLNGSGGSMTAQSAAERGAHADTPASLTLAAWREIAGRSEEHKSELQSLMRTSNAVF